MKFPTKQTRPNNDRTPEKVKTWSPAQAYPWVLERKLLPVSVAKQLRSTTRGFHLGYMIGPGLSGGKVTASDSYHSTCNYDQLCDKLLHGKLCTKRLSWHTTNGVDYQMKRSIRASKSINVYLIMSRNLEYVDPSLPRSESHNLMQLGCKLGKRAFSFANQDTFLHPKAIRTGISQFQAHSSLAHCAPTQCELMPQKSLKSENQATETSMKLANQPHSPTQILSPLSSVQVTGGFIPSWHFSPTIKLRLSLSSSTCIKRILFHLWRVLEKLLEKLYNCQELSLLSGYRCHPLFKPCIAIFEHHVSKMTSHPCSCLDQGLFGERPC